MSSKRVAEAPRAAGRKRDHSKDAVILDAALAVLAETGYERMTIDLVAARAQTARATVYRRWATKADLAVAAVARMSEADAAPGELPDTGSLRGDLIATIRTGTVQGQDLRIKVMSGLHAQLTADPRLAEAAAGAGAAPWIEVNRALMQRAIDRGEFPPTDVTTLAQVMPMMCISRIAVQQKPITRRFSVDLIDRVIIPALRGG